jgi:hypothetical protein
MQLSWLGYNLLLVNERFPRHLFVRDRRAHENECILHMEEYNTMHFRVAELLNTDHEE